MAMEIGRVRNIVGLEGKMTERVSIGNIKGSVSVTGWDRNEVRVTGRLGDGAKPLEITGGDGSLSIKVEAQGKSGWFGWGSDSAMGPSTLEVRVPRGASLDIDVVSAPLDVDGMDGGRIEINTVSGKARVNARTPSLSVNSVSGTVELAGHAEDRKTIHHPAVGPITIDCDVLVDSDTDLKIVIYTAIPGSEDAGRLELAMVLGAPERTWR